MYVLRIWEAFSHSQSPQVLGMGDEWEGGEMATGVGGGQKINLLRKELQKHKDNSNLVVMFTDRWALTRHVD